MYMKLVQIELVYLCVWGSFESLYSRYGNHLVVSADWLQRCKWPDVAIVMSDGVIKDT